MKRLLKEEKVNDKKINWMNKMEKNKLTYKKFFFQSYLVHNALSIISNNERKFIDFLQMNWRKNWLNDWWLLSDYDIWMKESWTFFFDYCDWGVERIGVLIDGWMDKIAESARIFLADSLHYSEMKRKPLFDNITLVS